MIDHEAIKDIPTYVSGYPPQYGIKWPSPGCPQGNDLMLELPLYFQDKPFYDVTGWKLELFIKKGFQADSILWRGTLNNGIYNVRDNIFLIRIPGSATAILTPGTYFYTIKGIKIVNISGFSISNSLGSGSIEITLDASGPHAKLFGPNVLTGDTENTSPLLITDLPDAETGPDNIGL